MKHHIPVTLLLAMALPAFAQEPSRVVYDDQAMPVVASSCLSQSGKMDVNKSISGFSKNIPLSVAVRQVTPKGFSVAENNIFSSELKDKRTSWSANNDWTEELKRICSDNKFFAHIDWSSKTVSLAPQLKEKLKVQSAPVPVKIEPTSVTIVQSQSAPSVQQSSVIMDDLLAPAKKTEVKQAVKTTEQKPKEYEEVVVLKEIEKTETIKTTTIVEEVKVQEKPAQVKQEVPAPTPPAKVVVEQKAVPAPAPAPVKPATVAYTAPQKQVVKPAQDPMKQTWFLDPALTLRENVELWTKKAGWSKVVWDAADYKIVAPAYFEGHFASQTGPLAQVIAAYDLSEQPLVARLSVRDKVVEIRNKRFMQTSVMPTTPAEISAQSSVK